MFDIIWALSCGPLANSEFSYFFFNSEPITNIGSKYGHIFRTVLKINIEYIKYKKDG